MLHIIGIGDNVVDRYLYKNKMYPGGNAVNVPVLAARTGLARAAYIGNLGSDAAGRHVLAALQSEKMDLSHIRVIEGQNAYADVTLVDGDRKFIGGSAGVSKNICLTEQDMLFIATYDLIHTSIYSGTDEILPQMRTSGCKIAYDYSDYLDLDALRATFPYVDFAIFSGGNRDEEELKMMMKEVCAAGPAQMQVLITMGSRGAILYRDGTFYRQGIFRIDEVVDTMGAGDSFIARYLAGIFNGEATQQSMENASEFAAKNCLIEGTFGYETEIQ